ncbi:hypothetical protein [Saccharospirillum mangrovi]|uniref:hypothetical protein n=1 Tax=Saccharospirillum mangrovi TaxID=2161747 RepID=UPI001300B055|nr:hypothetical protein [Saccharospirillum mangrovi]
MKYPVVAVMLTAVVLQGCQVEEDQGPTIDATGHWTMTSQVNDERSNIMVVDDNRFLILEDDDNNELDINFSTGTMNQSVTRASGQLTSDDSIWCDINLGADEFDCADMDVTISVESATRLTGETQVGDFNNSIVLEPNATLNKEVGVDDLVGYWVYLGTASLSIQADGTFTGTDANSDPISGEFFDIGPNEFKFTVNASIGDGKRADIPGLAYLDDDGRLVAGAYRLFDNGDHSILVAFYEHPAP